MAAPLAAVNAKGLNRRMTSHSTNTLKRWSCTDNDLPDVPRIKHLHVYDFDNTLFASPLPNRNLWTGPTIGMLQTQETFAGGGWWHDVNILAATGQGVEKEEPRAWDGWFNEAIVNLVELTMQQKDALNVLLTGRSETGFSELITRITKSKKLDFHMIVLQPKVGPMHQRFASTMKFKQAFLEELVLTYRDADEIRIYEDRVKHVTGFRDFFSTFNKSLLVDPPLDPRKTITAEVIEVAENSTSLDPVAEVAEVQRMINAHNTAYRAGTAPRNARPWTINRTAFYTAYLISPPDTEKLLAAANLAPKSLSADTRTLANSIMITPRPASQLGPGILTRIGGIGRKMRWRVVGTGVFDNRVWAARVEPVPADEKFYCERPEAPSVVLALRGMSRPADAARIQNWTPLPRENMFEFETVVGEKSLLRIDQERPADDGNARDGRGPWNSYGGLKRSRPNDDDFPPLGVAQQARPHGQQSLSVQSYRPSNYEDSRRSNHHNSQNSYRAGVAASQHGQGMPRYQTRAGGRGIPGPHRTSNGRGGVGRPRGRGGFTSGSYRSLDDRGAPPFGTDGARDDGGLTY